MAAKIPRSKSPKDSIISPLNGSKGGKSKEGAEYNEEGRVTRDQGKQKYNGLIGQTNEGKFFIRLALIGPGFIRFWSRPFSSIGRVSGLPHHDLSPLSVPSLSRLVVFGHVLVWPFRQSKAIFCPRQPGSPHHQTDHAATSNFRPFLANLILFF